VSDGRPERLSRRNRRSLVLLDPATGSPLLLNKLPLMLMDANLSDGADGFGVFSAMFAHLKESAVS
jgi:hypothetical protein